MAQISTNENIECPGGMPAFLAYPAAPGRYPAVVLMHERYGLVTHTKDLARRCAEDGYVALAPNFFFKHPDQPRLNAGNERYDMTDPESIVLLKSALVALSNTSFADMSKIAVAGYCQTGRHPLVFAGEVRIQAAVVWYGAAQQRDWNVNQLQPKPFDEIIAAVPCPVFGAFGAGDHLISVDDVRRFRTSLEQHKKSYEMHLYAGAPHGWLNNTMPGRYRRPQAEAGWVAQQNFLKAVFAGDWKPEMVRWDFASEFSTDYDFSKNVRYE